jgi:hypothetical protein
MTNSAKCAVLIQTIFVIANRQYPVLSGPAGLDTVAGPGNKNHPN